MKTELVTADKLKLGDVTIRKGDDGDILETIVVIEHRGSFVRMTVECEGKRYPMDERITKIIRRAA